MKNKNASFERFFWILILIPSACFISLRIYDISYYFFEAPMLSVRAAGALAVAVAVLAFIIKTPLTAIMTLKRPTIFFPAVVAAGTLLGGLFGKSVLLQPYRDTGILFFDSILSRAGAGIIFVFALSLAFICIKDCIASCGMDGMEKVWRFMLLPAVMLALLIGGARTFYYWDNVIYHKLAEYLMEAKNLPAALKDIYYSIQNWDYNYLGAALPAAFMKVFGSSRGIYLTANFIFYMIPSAVALYILSKVLQKNAGTENTPALPFFGAVALLVPYLVFLNFNGYVDIGGVALMALCLAVYFSRDKNIYLRLFCCGVILCFLVIFRRWFIFWCLSFIAAAVTDRLVFAVRGKKIIPWLLECAVLGTGFFGTLCLFFGQMFTEKFVMQSVAAAYAAYAKGLLHNFRVMEGYFGAALIALTVSAALFLFFKKSTAPAAAFLSGQAVVCFVLFTTVQSHDIHHILLYLPLIFSVLFMALSLLIPKANLVCSAAVCVVFLIGAIPPMIYDMPPVPMFARYKMHSNQAGNTREILSLAYYLDDLAENTGKKVAVLSASADLNREMIEYCEKSFNLSDRRRDYLVAVSNVDMADGFNDSIFYADYLVVPTKPAVYLGEQHQHVISEPSKYLHEGIGFAKAFKKMPHQFYLSENCTVEIFERIRDVTDEEKQEVLASIQSFYPDHPGIFK